MPSYMTIVVIALAASNVSVALPVPVPVHSSREVREQSLSRRDLGRDTPDPPPNTPPHGYPPPGYRPPGFPPPEGTETKPLLPENSVPSDKGPPPKGSNVKQYHIKFTFGTPATPSHKIDVPPPKGSNAKQYLMNFVVAAAATMGGISLLKAISNAFSNSRPAARPHTYSSIPSGQYGHHGPGVEPGQYYYQNQQRDVDHDKRADSFEAKARSNFDDNR